MTFKYGRPQLHFYVQVYVYENKWIDITHTNTYTGCVLTSFRLKFRHKVSLCLNRTCGACWAERHQPQGRGTRGHLGSRSAADKTSTPCLGKINITLHENKFAAWTLWEKVWTTNLNFALHFWLPLETFLAYLLKNSTQVIIKNNHLEYIILSILDYIDKLL